MKDSRKTKAQLLSELAELRARLAELEEVEAGRRRVEAALRESEAKYRTLIEQLPAVMYIAALDEQSSTLYQSPQIEQIVGFTAAEWTSDPDLWAKRLHPDDRERVLAELAHSHATGEPFHSEYRLIARDGHVVWVRDEAAIVRDEMGRPLILQGVLFDITLRKQMEQELQHRSHLEQLVQERTTQLQQEIAERQHAEEALRRSEALLSESQKIAHLGSWELDLVANRLTWSDEVYRIFGLRPQEFAATYEAFLERVHPDDRAAVDAAYWGSVRDGRDTYEIEHRVICKDTGQIRHVHEKCIHVRDASGNITRSIGMVHDITERKRTEQAKMAFYRISEAAQAAQDLDELFGRIHAIIGELMPAPNFYIALYDASADLFTTPYLANEFGVPPPPYKPRKGLNAYVLRTGEPLLVTPTVFERLVQSGQVELIGRPVVDWLGVPLKTPRGTIGVMAVYTYTEAARLTEADKDVLVFVSAQVAMAIERKQAEDALRASEARFRNLFEGLPACCWTFDRQGTILDWNRASQELYGWTAEQAVGKTMYELMVREENVAATQETIAAVFAGQSFQGLEYSDRRADGTTCDVLVNEYPVWDSQGQVIMGICAELDITERKRTEKEIQRLNQDLQRRARELAALNRAGQIMASTLDLNILLERVMEQVRILVDAEGASVLLRPTEADLASDDLVFAAATGPGAEKLPGLRLSWAGVAGWVMRERQAALIADAQNDPRHERQVDALTGLTTRSLLAVPLISKGTVLGVVEAVNKSAGTFDEHDLRVMEALTSSAAIAIENARLFSMVNQEKQRLEFLYHLSQQLAGSLDVREIAQRALDGLRAVAGLLRGLVAVREHDLLRVVAVSGYDAESLEALNQRLPLRVGYGLLGWVAAQRQLAVVDDVTQDPRWVVVSGLDEWVRSALSVPLLSGDELVGVLSIYSDRAAYFTEDICRLVESAAATVAVAITNARLFSTERQRATELARALEQQRELDRLQREFIQNVSHELRTPLSLIRGHAEVLEAGWLGELMPKQRESIEVISRRAQMLGKLVDDILRLLEIERRELRKEVVDLRQLVQTSLTDFQAAASQAGLTLRAEVLPEPAMVSGDPVALRRALDNLVGNALKFTPAGGSVSIRLSRSEGVVRLEVADTGIGIPSDQLTRIFERFYQVDGSATRKYGGVGLGLALVKEIVEAHGGQIMVASQVGIGTTFVIVLPMTAQDEP